MTEDPLVALQRHFEKEYGKLEMPGTSKRKKKRGAMDPESQKENNIDIDEEWHGITDVENIPSTFEPQVVSFIDTEATTEDDALIAHRGFMTSKIPKSVTIQKAAEPRHFAPSDDDEAQNLQNDIALQRLLRESNLLSEYAGRDDAGRLRHLTLDARISHLGGKEPTRGNVPLRIRKGIEAAKVKKQEKKERDAKETGILLPVKRKHRSEKVRERGLKAGSGVGKFKKGMLKISEREIRQINSTGSQLPRRGKSVKKLFK